MKSWSVTIRVKARELFVPLLLFIIRRDLLKPPLSLWMQFYDVTIETEVTSVCRNVEMLNFWGKKVMFNLNLPDLCGMLNLWIKC